MPGLLERSAHGETSMPSPSSNALNALLAATSGRDEDRMGDSRKGGTLNTARAEQNGGNSALFVEAQTSQGSVGAEYAKNMSMSSPGKVPRRVPGLEAQYAAQGRVVGETEKQQEDGRADSEPGAALVERLRRELLACQRSEQEAASRATVLTSQLVALQEQVARGEAREKLLLGELQERDAKLATSAKQMQAMAEGKSSSDEDKQRAESEAEDKQRELQEVTRRLREAERTLSKVVGNRGQDLRTSGKGDSGSPGASAAGEGADARGAVVDELMRRLRLRERELAEANAKIELLVSERKRQSMEISAGLGLGDVSREESTASVGSLAALGSGSSGSQDSEMELKKLRERMKIVEEALRAMRDEAREHVLSIKSSDIVLNLLLGSGSFAEVHSATWHLPCAVKRLKDNVRHNKYEVQKFQREAYLLRSLLHPGVLRVFGFCKFDHLLVTEVVTGGSLHGIIHNCAPNSTAPLTGPKKMLTHQEVLEYSAQVRVARLPACRP